MMLENVLKMQLSVGYGENSFTMSRGSFKYKKKIYFKRELKLTEMKEIEGGSVWLLNFTDEKTSDKHVIKVSCKDGLIKADYEGKAPEDINRFFVTLPADPDERIYGCGETYSKFNLKGENVRIWVAEHQNTRRISSKIIKQKLFGKRPKKTAAFSKYESYYVQPTFTSSDRYFLHADTDSYSEFDFTGPDTITLRLQEEPHLIIGEADSFEELSFKLSGVLGRQRELPDWIYDGAVIAVQEGCEAVDETLKKAWAAGAEINGVWCQDWCGCRRTGFGYQVMWNWRWDNELYRDLPEKIKEWKAKGVHFLGYINPFMAIEKDIYKEAAEKGYCVKDREGKDYLVTITTFPAAMIDLTNPEAYDWYKDIIKKNLIGIGLSGWMADFGEYLPTDCVLYSGEDAEKVHNTWPAIWAKLNREAIEECGEEDEIFFFTRAGYTETVKYSPCMWTGDHHVDWSLDDGIPSVIPATLSLAMSGFGITHSDAGGYTTIMQMRRSKELLLRWMEMNVFSSVYRFHEGNQPVNNVQITEDEETLAHLALCSKLHRALKDYLKELVKEAADKGVPVMRPLFYYCDEDAAYDEKSEYLLGRDILAAPVLKEGATQRQVYLPEGSWLHLFTGQEYSGGNFNIEAPIGKPPVFLRKEKAEYFRKLFDIAKG